MAKVSNFNERFVALIETIGQTDYVLADRLGVSKQALSSWRTGHRSPTRSTIEHIADVFDIDVAWLMGYDVPMTPPQALPVPSSGTLTEDEQRLLMAYRNASDDLRLAAIAMLESFQGAGKKSPDESTGT